VAATRKWEEAGADAWEWDETGATVQERGETRAARAVAQRQGLCGCRERLGGGGRECHERPIDGRKEPGDNSFVSLTAG